MVEQDRIFMKNFSLLIAGLAVMTLALITLGSHLNGRAQHGNNPHRAEKLEARIAPVSQNHLGAEGEAAVAEISAQIDASNQVAGAGAPLASAAASTPAAAEAIDGGAIYNSVCFACHMTGAGGAPKLEAAAWESRIAKGSEQLAQNAINGFQGDSGVMPAKGGRLDLSDEAIKATVQWMLDNIE